MEHPTLWLARIQKYSYQYYINLLRCMIADVDQLFEEPILPLYTDVLKRLDYLKQLGSVKLTNEEITEIDEIQQDLKLFDDRLNNLATELSK